VDQHLDLWTLPIAANLGKVLGKPEPLTHTAANSFRPSLSVDGKRLVFLSNRSGNSDVWLKDMVSGNEAALTATPWDESHAWIAADGSKVAYASWEKQNPVIYFISLDAGGKPTPAVRLCEGQPFGWSQDGKRILYFGGHGYRSIDVVTRQQNDVMPFEKHNLHRAQFSPDGQWLSFHVPLQAEGARSPVFIAPLRSDVAASESEWIQVTEGTGLDAGSIWSPDGDTLYFLSKRDGFKCIWAQRLDKRTKQPAGAPFDVVHFHSTRHTVNEPLFGPGVSSDKLVFALSENTGNVWTAKPESQK
jgi:Tol biopolymer transport system component